MPRLPYCVEPAVARPASATLAGCAANSNVAVASAPVHSSLAHPRLCAGLATILSADCASLGSLPFLTGVIEAIGLVNDPRGERLYGPAAKHVIRIGHSQRVGLWQEPQQIAGAMIELASRVRVRRYVEIGVYTAWTTSVMAAYLSRMQPEGKFEGWAVDITSAHITPGTMQLLHGLNVSFLPRKAFNSQLPKDPPPAPGYDVCFIDGDHSYGGVRSDYALMGPHCQTAMFHDIRDTSCLGAAEFSGGVPLFWQHLQRSLRSHDEGGKRTLELTKSGSTYLPMFGIGIVWAGVKGTAELDGDSAQPNRWPAWKGKGSRALWTELCAPQSRTRRGVGTSTAVSSGSSTNGASLATRLGGALEAALVTSSSTSSTSSDAAVSSTIVPPHPVCRASRPEDLAQMVYATKRHPKAGSVQYATGKWEAAKPKANRPAA